MRTDKRDVAGMFQKVPDGCQFLTARLLLCAQRVKADDDERVDSGQEICIERNL